MRFDVLTLFPDMFRAVLEDSITGRAISKGILSMNFIDIRDYTKDKHRRTDDYPYSGGGGMLMTPQPVYDAYMSVARELDYKPLTIYMSPQGRVFDQNIAKELLQYDHMIFLCGHYEGVDQRVLDRIVDMELSLGDFVLTGGEIPAMAVIDCVSRMVDGVLPKEDAYRNESHYSGLLEYPQYTRPVEFMGDTVPEVLLSGHHANIEKWRREQSIIRTEQRRPDLLEMTQLDEKEQKFLEEWRKNNLI